MNLFGVVEIFFEECCFSGGQPSLDGVPVAAVRKPGSLAGIRVFFSTGLFPFTHQLLQFVIFANPRGMVDVAP